MLMISWRSSYAKLMTSRFGVVTDRAFTKHLHFKGITCMLCLIDEMNTKVYCMTHYLATAIELLPGSLILIIHQRLPRPDSWISEQNTFTRALLILSAVVYRVFHYRLDLVKSYFKSQFHRPSAPFHPRSSSSVHRRRKPSNTNARQSSSTCPMRHRRRPRCR